MANLNYVRHDTTNTADSPQPGSTTVTHFDGTEGWTVRQWKDFNADYQARNVDNTARTPGTYQARNSDNTTRTPSAYQRHGKDNNVVSDVAVVTLNLVVGAIYQDSYKGAVFIYDADGTNPIKVNSSDTSTFDLFATAVAVGNDKIGVGMKFSDDAGGSSGSAFIYDLDGTNEVKLTASDAAASDKFGTSVAIGNNKIAIGSPEDDDGGADSGSVYVYNLDGTGEVKIIASDDDPYDNFGTSVAIGNDKIYVGAPYTENPGFNSGLVYIYNLDGTGEVKITASDGATNDYFGTSVATGNDKFLVGAEGGESVYVYNLDGTGEVKITASDGAAGDKFGHSVAIGNNKIVVGSYQDDDGGSDSGSVYVYNLDGTGEVKITASDGAANEYFGFSVAVDGDKIYVGASQANNDDDTYTSIGAIYIYNLDGTGEVKIPNPNQTSSNSQAQFGTSVAIG